MGCSRIFSDGHHEERPKQQRIRTYDRVQSTLHMRTYKLCPEDNDVFRLFSRAADDGPRELTRG